jgi:hypothetical protein
MVTTIIAQEINANPAVILIGNKLDMTTTKSRIGSCTQLFPVKEKAGKVEQVPSST